MRVALDVPLAGPFDYLPPSDDPLTADDIGRRVLVPFGRRRLAGVVLAVDVVSDWPAEQLKTVDSIDRRAPPVPAEVLALASFAAEYYRANLGEVLLPALPPALRSTRKWRMPRPLVRDPLEQPAPPAGADPDADDADDCGAARTPAAAPTLTAEQAAALATLSKIGGRLFDDPVARRDRQRQD